MKAIGFDQPLYVQYLHWMGGAIHGDFGRSYTTQQSVADTFYRAKLIPKAVTVKDNVWQDQDALTAR